MNIETNKYNILNQPIKNDIEKYKKMILEVLGDNKTTYKILRDISNIKSDYLKNMQLEQIILDKITQYKQDVMQQKMGFFPMNYYKQPQGLDRLIEMFKGFVGRKETTISTNKPLPSGAKSITQPNNIYDRLTIVNEPKLEENKINNPINEAVKDELEQDPNENPEEINNPFDVSVSDVSTKPNTSGVAITNSMNNVSDKNSLFESYQPVAYG